MNKEHISGIHNYCDRWCEKCRFVTRCAVGSSERLENMELQMALANNEEEEQKIMLDYVSDAFSEMKNTLEAYLEEQGTSWEEVLSESEHEPVKRPEPSPLQEKLSVQVKEYAEMVNDWFSDHEDHFKADAVTAKLLAHPGDEEDTANQIKNAMEVVHWYKYFIDVKMRRAWSGMQDPWIEEDPLQNDWNGSAKVALIAIDNSLEAWRILLEFFPELEDCILGQLAQLDRIRNGMLRAFPDAYRFIRPGFDDQPNRPDRS